MSHFFRLLTWFRNSFAYIFRPKVNNGDIEKKSDNKIRFLLLFYLQNVFLDNVKQFICNFRWRFMKIYNYKINNLWYIPKDGLRNWKINLTLSIQWNRSTLYLIYSLSFLIHWKFFGKNLRYNYKCQKQIFCAEKLMLSR